MLMLYRHTRANQLLPQLLMEQFDTFTIQSHEHYADHKMTAVRRQFFPNKVFVYA